MRESQRESADLSLERVRESQRGQRDSERVRDSQRESERVRERQRASESV